MSDSSKKPWSNDVGPRHIQEPPPAEVKSDFFGLMISAILYGIVIILFSQCMAALLNRFDRKKGGIRWGLVAHAVLMFLFMTINAMMTFGLEFTCNINDRAFPGNSQILPGPIAYQELIYPETICVVPSLMYQLNQWLADGLLLYRCHIIYSMSYWIIAFPCLIYLASVAIGIFLFYLQFRPDDNPQFLTTLIHFRASYFSISLALNVLLTLMIVVRLGMHARNMQNAIGTQDTTDGLYKGIVAILIESFALYSVTLLLLTALNAAKIPGAVIFNQISPMTQTIAPFLIMVRVARRRAVTSDDMSSGGIGSIRFRSQGVSTDENGIVPDGNPVGAAETNGEAPRESNVTDGNAIEAVQAR